MKTILTIATLLINLGTTAQGYLFVGVQGIKEAGVDYWCQNQTYETTPIASAEEYNALKKEFLDRKPTWPATWLLTPEQAAVIYEMNKKMDGFNCTRKGIGIAKGATIEGAIEEMKKITSQCKECDPQILFRWDPKGVQEKFTDKLGGVDLTAIKRVNSNGEKTLYVTLTNTNASQAAMVTIIGSKSQELFPPTLIQAGNKTNFSIADQGAIHWFVETFVQNSGNPDPDYYQQFKQWIKEITVVRKKYENQV